MTVELAAVQAYLRHVARQRYDTVEWGEGSVHIHPTSAEPSWSYAVPNARAVAQPSAFLERARRAFSERGRPLRLELVTELFEDLAGPLARAGLRELERQPLLAVTPAAFMPVSGPAGYMAELGGRVSPRAFLRDVATTQGHAFTGAPIVLGDDAIDALRTGLDGGRVVIARTAAAEPVAAGALAAIACGFGEITGVGTVPAHRRRGLGAWVSSLCVEEAWRRGASCVVLTASGEPAERTYRRLGFRLTGHVSVWTEAS